MKRFSIFLIIMMVFTLAIASKRALAAAPFITEWRSVSFETAMPVSVPKDAGLDAVTVSSPPDAAPGKALLEVALVAVSGDMRAGLGDADQAVMDYVKTTFLGVSGGAEKPVQRNFLGRAVSGKSFSSKIPSPRDMELYLVPLSSGDSMAVAFSAGRSVTSEDFQAFIARVAATFREAGMKTRP